MADMSGGVSKVQSQHGRWTVSSSDDEDADPAQATGRPLPFSHSVRKDYVSDSDETVVDEGELEAPHSGQGNAASSSGPSEFAYSRLQTSTAGKTRQECSVTPAQRPSPALKRSRPSSESGWGVSSSDEESDVKAREWRVKEEPVDQASPGQREKKPRLDGTDYPSPSVSSEATWRSKLESGSEPLDKWDVLEKAKHFSFYLTKVSGIPAKSNCGALHIK
ncbi:tyrosyl-DNA phosphodiesterase 1-like, partial [Rhincodon typus]|uniref:tyrosyl-DNA phosphodiesterase 1-like n=1 Tax=Rhincodon typus TaxID=259920 RepID=UPI00202FCB9A